MQSECLTAVPSIRVLCRVCDKGLCPQFGLSDAIAEYKVNHWMIKHA